MLLILVLGFVSGLPLGLTGTTLQAWYTVEGVDIVTIGFLSLVGQPYVYKFLWAPFMDKWRLPFLGLRRGWMLATQCALIISLLAMAFTQPSQEPYYLAFLGLCVAFFSASQDIAIDAYRTELLTAQERGLGTSMAVSGYRIAMLVSSGLTLMLAHYVGFAFTFVLMAALMALGIIATLFAKEPVHYREPSPHFLKACVAPFKDILTRPFALGFLLFIMIYKLGDVFAGGLTTVFLLNEVGFTLLDLGITYKTIGTVATLSGAFVGGALMVKIGLYRSLFIFGIVQALTNLLFLLLSWAGPDYGILLATIFLDNFGGGLGNTAFMVLIMSLCRPPYTATQFALLSAITAIGRVYVGPFAGLLVKQLGWSQFFIWTVILAVPGLFLLWILRKPIAEFDGEYSKSLKKADVGLKHAT